MKPFNKYTPWMIVLLFAVTTWVSIHARSDQFPTGTRTEVIQKGDRNPYVSVVDIREGVAMVKVGNESARLTSKGERVPLSMNSAEGEILIHSVHEEKIIITQTVERTWFFVLNTAVTAFVWGMGVWAVLFVVWFKWGERKKRILHNQDGVVALDRYRNSTR